MSRAGSSWAPHHRVGRDHGRDREAQDHHLHDCPGRSCRQVAHTRSDPLLNAVRRHPSLPPCVTPVPTLAERQASDCGNPCGKEPHFWAYLAWVVDNPVVHKLHESNSKISLASDLTVAYKCLTHFFGARVAHQMRIHRSGRLEQGPPGGQPLGVDHVAATPARVTSWWGSESMRHRPAVTTFPANPEGPRNSYLRGPFPFAQALTRCRAGHAP